jgi:hypothetical protein
LINGGENAVIQVMRHADADAHGAGYWLQLQLVDGTVVLGAVVPPENGVICVTAADGSAIWVVLDQIATVKIEW